MVNVHRSITNVNTERRLDIGLGAGCNWPNELLPTISNDLNADDDFPLFFPFFFPFFYVDNLLNNCYLFLSNAVYAYFY